MDYQTAIAYLYSFTDFERDTGQGQLAGVFGLERIRQLLGELADPQHTAPVIHLAGTKGKGSTAAMIESILRRSGLRTGLFISPHLHDFAERIQIDGRPIPADEVTGAIEALRPLLDPRHQPPAEGGLTTFEITTALAFYCFRQAGVDVQVIETGLGGRLDATNVVDPRVAVITPVGYDHTAILGTDLASIAEEKAGILKAGSRVIIGPQAPEALAVILARCAAQAIRPRLFGQDFAVVTAPPREAGQQVTITSARAERPYQAVLPLIGRHQAENAAVAVAAVEELLAGDRTVARSRPSQLSTADRRRAIEDGLGAVQWPGRFQIVHRQPWVIADGAHTGESATRLRETLAELFPGRRLTVVLGTSRDKPVEAIVTALAPLAHAFVASAADHPRALEPEVLRARAESAGITCRVAPSTRQALDQWLDSAGSDEVLIATGSLFVAAEALRWSSPLSRSPLAARR